MKSQLWLNAEKLADDLCGALAWPDWLIGVGVQYNTERQPEVVLHLLEGSRAPLLHINFLTRGIQIKYDWKEAFPEVVP